MKNKVAYTNFLSRLGIEDHLLERLTYRQMDAVEKLLKSLPPSMGNIQRHPFDIIRLYYGFHGKRFSLRDIAEIYTVSATIISRHITNIQNKLTNKKAGNIKNIFYPKPPPLKNLTFKEKLSCSIDEFELPTRTNNCLKAAGIKTIRDLVYFKELNLLRLQNFGRKNLNAIKEKLFEIELFFNLDEDRYKHLTNKCENKET